jgi:hypothetical protein
VRFLVAPDPPEGPDWQPVFQDQGREVYDFLAGGMQSLRPCTCYLNRTALPRMFVVPYARPLPGREDVLAALKETNFLETVLLEDYESPTDRPSRPRASRGAYVVRYHPNEIELHVRPGDAGFLVLTDLWYPGWTCTVDGEPARLYRANYCFRAVELLAGEHTVVFRFEPRSFRVGLQITRVALAAAAVLGLIGLVWRRRPTAPPGPSQGTGPA